MQTRRVTSSCLCRTEIEGLRRKLVGKLSPETESLMADWEVGECIGSFWRPNHHPSVYPYSPAHITNPKEVVKLYIVPLRERCFFAVRQSQSDLHCPSLLQGTRSLLSLFESKPQFHRWAVRGASRLGCVGTCAHLLGVGNMFGFQ